MNNVPVRKLPKKAVKVTPIMRLQTELSISGFNYAFPAGQEGVRKLRARVIHIEPTRCIKKENPKPQPPANPERPKPVQTSSEVEAVPVKRGRGRPRKIRNNVPNTSVVQPVVSELKPGPCSDGRDKDGESQPTDDKPNKDTLGVGQVVLSCLRSAGPGWPRKSNNNVPKTSVVRPVVSELMPRLRSGGRDKEGDRRPTDDKPNIVPLGGSQVVFSCPRQSTSSVAPLDENGNTNASLDKHSKSHESTTTSTVATVNPTKAIDTLSNYLTPVVMVKSNILKNQIQPIVRRLVDNSSSVVNKSTASISFDRRFIRTRPIGMGTDTSSQFPMIISIGNLPKLRIDPNEICMFKRTQPLAAIAQRSITSSPAPPNRAPAPEPPAIGKIVKRKMPMHQNQAIKGILAFLQDRSTCPGQYNVFANTNQLAGGTNAPAAIDNEFNRDREDTLDDIMELIREECGRTKPVPAGSLVLPDSTTPDAIEYTGPSLNGGLTKGANTLAASNQHNDRSLFADIEPSADFALESLDDIPIEQIYAPDEPSFDLNDYV